MSNVIYLSAKKRKDHYYRIIDEYTLFYLHWIEPLKADPRTFSQTGYWQKASRTPEAITWSGYAFEEVCYKHVYQIAKALELDHVLWRVSSWRQINKDDGAQIDLLFDRGDGIITIVEIKYSINQYTIDKSYAKRLINKIEIFEKYTKTNKAVQLVMVTTSGVHDNAWYQELIQAEVTLNGLFVETEN